MSGIPMHELVREPADVLPRREALGLVNITNITAVNVSIALNAATIGSTAVAGATQGIVLFQS
jgi:hypothetical protein